MASDNVHLTAVMLIDRRQHVMGRIPQLRPEIRNRQ
jgi:hypothetical protein